MLFVYWMWPYDDWSSYGPMEIPILIRCHFDGLMQERRNSIANALELHNSCINLLIFLLKQALNSNLAYISHKTDSFVYISLTFTPSLYCIKHDWANSAHMNQHVCLSSQCKHYSQNTTQKYVFCIKLVTSTWMHQKKDSVNKHKHLTKIIFRYLTVQTTSFI